MSDRRDDKGAWRGRLDRLFVETPGGECSREEAAEAAALFRQIAGDDEARGHFDRLAHADRALRGDVDSPGDFERGFGEAAFLGALDELLAEEEGAEVVSLEQRRRPRVMALVASLAAGLALAAGAWQLTETAQRPSGPADTEFQARSSARLPGAEGSAAAVGGPRVEVYCVSRDDGGELRFTGPDQAPFGVVRCGLDDEIKIAIADAPGDLRFTHLVGVADDGTLYWYGPSPADDRAHELSPPRAGGADDASAPVPVGESIRLGVNHRPGPVRVHAVMTRTPMDHESFAAFVEARRQRASRATIDVAGTGFVAASRVFEVVEERR